MTPSPQRPRHGRSRGQTMPLFAAFLLAIIATAGLAIDAGLSYTADSAAEGAAAAAALAGASYLPGSTSSAITTAKQIAARNGYVDGANGVTVTATTAGTKMTVTISQTINRTFIAIFGWKQGTINTTEAADSAPPIYLGQAGAQVGSDIYNMTNAYFMRLLSYGNLRQDGDPYSTSPTFDGSSSPNPVDYHAISDQLGTESHYASLPDYGGYNYLIYVPAGKAVDVQVFNPVFGPSYNTANGMGSHDYHEHDSIDSSISPTPPSSKVIFPTTWYTLFAVNNPSYHVGETIYSQYDFRGIDAVNCSPGNDPSQVSCTSGSGYYYLNPGNNWKADTATPSPLWHWDSMLDWVADGPGNSSHESDWSHHTVDCSCSTISGAAGTGSYYRLRVDNEENDGTPSAAGGSQSTHAQGKHGYAVRVWDPSASAGAGALCSTCTIAALNEMCFYTDVTGTTIQIPLLSLPTAYANSTLTVNLFDPGDSTGPAPTLQIMIPAYGTHAQAVATLDASVGTGLSNYGAQLGGSSTNVTPNTPGKADAKVSNSGANDYNGKWLQYRISVPADWVAPNTGTNADFWQLQYSNTSGSAYDTVTLKVTSSVAPVHLV